MADSALWPVQILLLGSAVPVAVEAYKAKPPGFYILWAITALMVVIGLLAPVLVSPAMGAILYGIATNPSTWFVGAVAMFFVLRPYWSQHARTDKAASSTYAAPAALPFDDAELRSMLADNSEILETLARDAQNFRERLAALEERVTEALERQTSLPFLEGRLRGAQKREQTAKEWLASAATACELLAEFIGQVKAGEHAETSPHNMEFVLRRAQDNMKLAMSVQNDRNWPEGDRFVWEDCKPQIRRSSTPTLEPSRFDLSENARFVACLENLLRRGLDFERRLKQFAEQRRREKAAIESQIKAELMRIDAG